MHIHLYTCLHVKFKSALLFMHALVVTLSLMCTAHQGIVLHVVCTYVHIIELHVHLTAAYCLTNLPNQWLHHRQEMSHAKQETQSHAVSALSITHSHV